jgi:hypothetical protein
MRTDSRCPACHLPLDDMGHCQPCIIAEMIEGLYPTDKVCPVCEKPAILNENGRCAACEETSRWIMEMWAAGKCPACHEEGHSIQECPAHFICVRVPRAAVRA